MTAARRRALPQCAPKDSAAYRRWYAANEEGRRLGQRPVFAPRSCRCGASFVPKVGNQGRCDDCIAADPWHSAKRRSRLARRTAA